MEHKQHTNPFAQSAHEKAQGAIDQATNVRATAAEKVRESHEKSHREAYLIDDAGTKRCSVCKLAFDTDVKPSLTVAFTKHVSGIQQPEQNMNQAAAPRVDEKS
jgi:hypothetical protein